MTTTIFDAPYRNEHEISGWLSEDGHGHMRGGEYLFTPERNADWLIVTDTPHSCFWTDIPRERRILFIAEPKEIHDCSKIHYYVEQFGIVVTHYELPGYTGRVITSNPNLGWTAGMKGELSTLTRALNFQPLQKTRALSIITSLKQKTPYHRKRLAFLRELQREFAGEIDCFGREFNPVDDKLDAVALYKYHVVIENSRHNYYWTEKLCDAWAGWALPIYCGDPAILQQVPDKNGIVIIDVDDAKGSLRKIREVIDGDVYSSRLEAIARCREWALKASDRYETTCRIIEASHDTTPKLARPELFKRLVSRSKNAAYELMKGVSLVFADKVFEAYHRMKGRVWE